MASSAPAPSSPKAVLKGALTVKINKCTDLEKKRLIGKMDPYVKLNAGGSEKFKTKVADNMDKDPVFDQTFLFNLTGVETDLHLRVYDSELLSDSYIGRMDSSIVELLKAGGGAKTYDLFDPENFRKVTGKIDISVRFDGSGGPAEVAELAPIMGPFHFQHNMTGLLVHPAASRAVGDKLALKVGGMNDYGIAFEFQGPYIRFVGSQAGLYITGAPDGSSLTLQAGISDSAKFKWTGLGLQHSASGKLMHPENDASVVGTPMVLVSGATPASGFSLVACAALAPLPSPVTPSTPVGAPSYSHPATNPHAAAAGGAGPEAALAAMSLNGAGAAAAWNCPHCTYLMNGSNASKAVCDVCHKSRGAPLQQQSPHQQQHQQQPSAIAVPQAAAPAFDLNFPATWPDQAKIHAHQHPLKKTAKVYKGTYNCDVCKDQGQGIAYHCSECSYDVHPACVHQLLALNRH